MQRTNMSMAILCMIPPKHVQSATNSSSTSPNDSYMLEAGRYDWSKQEQGFIFSAYYFGYIFTQILSSHLTMNHFGPKKVLMVGVLGGSIGTVLSAPATSLGLYALIACRFLTGIFHVTTTSAFYARWAPSLERSRLIGFTKAGQSIGTVVSFMLGGYLCENGFYYGWGSIFILFGSFGFVWLVGFILFTASSPVEHDLIKENEKVYIIESIPEFHQIKKTPKMPWIPLLTSRPSLAVIIADFCSSWGFYMFLTQTPYYLEETLDFDLRSVQKKINYKK
jgi:MFS family permease